MGLSSQGTILIHGFPILTETWTLSQSHRSSPEYVLLMPVEVVAVAVVVVVVAKNYYFIQVASCEFLHPQNY